MGSTTTLVSVDEYLNTSYEPDMEYVDGVLVEQNVGAPIQSRLQTIVAVFFEQYRKAHRFNVFVAPRLRVTAGREYRVPDVVVLEGPYRKGKALEDVPAVVIEIKSPSDTFDDVVVKCFEYEKLGVANNLFMDPDHHQAWLFRQGSLQLLTGPSIALELPRAQTTIDFPFAHMFAELDED